MGKKILTEEMENFINISYSIVQQFCVRKKLSRAFWLSKGPNPDLTIKEREIAELVSKGCSNKEIQEKQCITLATVKCHLNNMYAKYGLVSYNEIGSACKRLRFALEYLRRNNKLID